MEVAKLESMQNKIGSRRGATQVSTSSGRMLGQPNSFTGATHSSTGSARPGGIRETNAGMILLTIGALVAYQLRRKQRLLEQSPFAA